MTNTEQTNLNGQKLSKVFVPNKKSLEIQLKGQLVNIDVLNHEIIYKRFIEKNLEAEELYNVYECCLKQSPKNRFVVITPIKSFVPIRLGTIPVYLERIKSPVNDPLIGSTYNTWENQYPKEIYLLAPEMDVKSIINKWGVKGYYDRLNYYLDPGTHRDPAIIMAAKSILLKIPNIPGPETVKKWQKYNNHALIFTNIQTGKSNIADKAGEPLYKDYSDAGLFGGGYAKDKKKGLLDGRGLFLFDEINTIEKNVMLNLLTIMEQGRVSRAIHGGIDCSSLKTIYLTGNPLNDNIEMLQLNFYGSVLNKIGATESTKRVGRRFGLYLYGVDYNKVRTTSIDKWADEFEPLMLRLIHAMADDCYSKIIKLYFLIEPWLNRDDEDYRNTIAQIAEQANIPEIKELLIGLSEKYNTHIGRARFAAFRATLVEMLALIYKTSRFPNGLPNLDKIENSCELTFQNTLKTTQKSEKNEFQNHFDRVQSPKWVELKTKTLENGGHFIEKFILNLCFNWKIVSKINLKSFQNMTSTVKLLQNRENFCDFYAKNSALIESLPIETVMLLTTRPRSTTVDWLNHAREHNTTSNI